MGFELYKGYFKEGKIREGNRGGLGLFNWDQVKGSEYKANYVGNSVKASEGRWQNHKDIHWYHKEKKVKDSKVELDELAEIKRLEEKAMREAMGIKDEELEVEEDASVVKDKERKRREEIKAALISARDEKVIGIGHAGEKRREIEKDAKKSQREKERESRQRSRSPNFQRRHRSRSPKEGGYRDHRVRGRDHDEQDRYRYDEIGKRKENRKRSVSPYGSRYNRNKDIYRSKSKADTQHRKY